MSLKFIASLAVATQAARLQQGTFEPTVLPAQRVLTDAASFTSSNPRYNQLGNWNAAPQGLVGGQAMPDVLQRRTTQQADFDQNQLTEMLYNYLTQ